MISTAELVSWARAEEADGPELRKLERSAIAAAQRKTGCYFGPRATISETVRPHGAVLALANEPQGPVTLEEWSGGAWLGVAGFYVEGRLVWSDAGRWTGVRYRASFQAGGEPDASDPPDPDVWDAPDDVKQIVRMMVAHRWANREIGNDGEADADVERAFALMLSDYRATVI